MFSGMPNLTFRGRRALPRAAVGGAVAILFASMCVSVGSGSVHAFPFSGSLGGPGACTTTAAQTQGWGSLEHSDDFADAASLDNWHRYDGAGHAGNGLRTPDAVTVSDGAMVISADLAGNSGGVTPRWGGRLHGRWEICARSTVASTAWTPNALLWPDAEDWPAGGEVNFMEIPYPLRDRVDYNLHWGNSDNLERHTRTVDATAWHNWAVEWTPTHIAVFLDGVEWARSSDVNRLPPRSMHLALQLDNYGGVTFPAGALYIDRVAEYPL